MNWYGWTLFSALVMGSVGVQAKTSTPCHDFSKRIPNVSERTCRTFGLMTSGARSVKGYPLLMRDVGKLEASSFSQRRVLIVGGIHGDELTSVYLALSWLSHALAETRQPAYTATTHWRFIPALNPDGLMTRPATRTNAHGIDLNRNFPTPNWAQEAPRYWKEKTREDKRRYPGKSPLSEPESRFLGLQIEQYSPHLIVSIHAPFGVLDFDGPPGEGYVPPSKLGTLYLDRVGVYPGSLGNYAGVHKGIPVVTIELPNAQRPPTDQEVFQMWHDLQHWMNTHMNTRNAQVPVQDSSRSRQNP